MIKIAIVGATGAVGREILSLLCSFKKKILLDLFASKKSIGKKIYFNKKSFTLKDTDKIKFENYDVCFFCVGKEFSKKYGKVASKKTIVIDNSSFFRQDKNVPLIIPEINKEKIKNKTLLSNPNCTTAIASIPLWVLHKNFGLKKVFISSYQAVSGAGQKGIFELLDNTKKYLKNQKQKNEVFKYDIAFNIIPHIDSFEKNSYTKEEMKLVNEIHKIFSDNSIKISSTCVRIPVLRSHSENIVVETKKEVDLKKFRNLLKKTKGVSLKDDIKKNIYPMPKNSTNKFDVEVGRIRHNLIFGKKSCEFFVSGDQLLKGAALNAFQIFKEIFNKK